MNIVYFIAPLLIFGYLTARQTKYGLYIILATVPGFLLRTRIWFVPTTWLELAIYTLVLIWIIKHIKKETLEPRLFYILHQAKPYIIPLSILILSVLISILVADNQTRSLGILKAWFFAPILFGIVFLDTIKTHHTLIKSIFYFSLSAWPIMIYGLIEYILGVNMTIFGRLDSFFSSPNYVAMYLVPMTVFILGWTMLYKKRLYLFIWLSFAIITIFLTKSFGGWFSLLTGSILLFIFIPKPTLKKSAGLIFGLIAASILIFYAHQKTFYHYDPFWQKNSLQTRIEIWTNSLSMLGEHPILGIGLGDFKKDYRHYIDKLPQKKQPIEQEVLRPHNLYLDLWLEAGLLGLTAFLWLILIFFKQQFNHYFKKKNLFVIPSSMAMVSLLVHGFVDTPYFKNDLSFLFWFLITVNLVLIYNSKQN